MDATINDTICTQMIDDITESLTVGISSVIGKRKEQQDSVYAEEGYALMEHGDFIAVLCDGMGGLTGGKRASELCVELVKEQFRTLETPEGVHDFYGRVLNECDRRICLFEDEEGKVIRAGTTFVSVIIRDGKLNWTSVGDSHIYLMRNQKMMCIVNEHNYMSELREKVAQGLISQEEADTHPKREALVSYVGMGGIKLIDKNAQPYELQDGDYIILCSDGLYRTVSDEEISGIVYGIGDARDAAECLTDYAMQKGKKNQDNTSVIVIQYHNLRYL